jgi:hypothetical protein
MKSLGALFVLTTLLLTACNKDQCAIREALRVGYGNRRIDCAAAKVEHTGKACGDGWKLVSVRGCRVENGPTVTIDLALKGVFRCEGRSAAGLCYE